MATDNRTTVNKTMHIAVLGLGCAGKSTLVVRYARNRLITDDHMTIEDEYIKTVRMGGRNFDLVIHDTAGEIDYFSVIDQQIEKADAIMVVYSVAKASSFQLAEMLYQRATDVIERPTKPSKKRDGGIRLWKTPFVLVGNMTDRFREVTTREGMGLATKMGCPLFETSATFGINVSKPFQYLASEFFFPGKPLMKEHGKKYSASICTFQ